MTIASEVGRRIRHYRKKKGLSQEKLAELCDFHPTYIGQLERGEKNASLETIYRITKGLGIPMGHFLENIDMIVDQPDNIPLELYHKCAFLPEKKQKALKKIIDDLLEFMN